jgi:hypothetical protein
VTRRVRPRGKTPPRAGVALSDFTSRLTFEGQPLVDNLPQADRHKPG